MFILLDNFHAPGTVLGIVFLRALRGLLPNSTQLPTGEVLLRCCNGRYHRPQSLEMRTEGLSLSFVFRLPLLCYHSCFASGRLLLLCVSKFLSCYLGNPHLCSPFTPFSLSSVAFQTCLLTANPSFPSYQSWVSNFTGKIFTSSIHQGLGGISALCPWLVHNADKLPKGLGGWEISHPVVEGCCLTKRNSRYFRLT